MPRRRVFKPLSECDYVRVAEKLSAADTLSYFERIRGYVQHEDGLISSRLTWSLTIHGFLFAIYGLLTGKLIDILMNEHVSQSDILHSAISVLFAVQALAALFGFVVGFQSHLAIGAASRALLHIRSIAHASPALRLESRESLVSLECAINEPGVHAVTTCPSREFVDGEGLLVDEGAGSRAELVRVTRANDGGLKANFQQTHDAGATIRPLGFALLPKVVNGGAPDTQRHGAAGYYLSLPAWAAAIWFILFVCSAFLAVTSHRHPEFLLNKAAVAVPAQTGLSPTTKPAPTGANIPTP